MKAMIDQLRMTNEQMKNSEDKRKEAAKSQVIFGKDEKEKLKKLATENFTMKLKLKELFDVITSLEKDNKANIGKFKNYILGSRGYTDGQKQELISKIEELFTVDISSKINMKELEFLSRIDESMLKDKFLRDCIGDPSKLLKDIK